MRYKSTRGQVSDLSFTDCVLSGLADDGGLLIPNEVPRITTAELKAWQTLDWPGLADRECASQGVANFFATPEPGMPLVNRVDRRRVNGRPCRLEEGHRLRSTGRGGRVGPAR